MKPIKKVAILGCGNSGMTLAADLTLKGFQVAVWSAKNHDSKFRKILEKNHEIILQEKNLDGTLSINTAIPFSMSYNLEEVFDFSRVIFNCTPMMAHTPIFCELAKYLRSASNLDRFFINVGGLFSGLDQFLNSEQKNIFEHLHIFDIPTFNYGALAQDENVVKIFRRKAKIFIAPLFANSAEYLGYLGQVIFSKLNLVKNIFELGLTGTNSVFHPPAVLVNARLIDNGESFLLYKNGISKRTALLYEALDQERLMLASKMGYNLRPCVEDDNAHYGTNFKNLYEFSINSVVHAEAPAPSTLNHRYIAEDVAYGLVPLLSLGNLYDLDLPNIRAVVRVFSTIMDTDYMRSGRSLGNLTIDMINKLSRHDRTWKDLV